MTYARKIAGYPVPLLRKTLGYFADLSKAEYYLSFPNISCFWFLKKYPFKIFVIEEHGTTYFLQHCRTRVYAAEGRCIGEHSEDGHIDNPRFKPGDIIEFVNGDELDLGVVTGLPPQFPRTHGANKLGVLDIVIQSEITNSKQLYL